MNHFKAKAMYQEYYQWEVHKIYEDIARVNLRHTEKAKSWIQKLFGFDRKKKLQRKAYLEGVEFGIRMGLIQGTYVGQMVDLSEQASIPRFKQYMVELYDLNAKYKCGHIWGPDGGVKLWDFAEHPIFASLDKVYTENYMPSRDTHKLAGEVIKGPGLMQQIKDSDTRYLWIGLCLDEEYGFDRCTAICEECKCKQNQMKYD